MNDRLPDIIDHKLEACAYIEGMKKQHFLSDKRTQQAVILNIMVVGEAATKLLKEYSNFLDACPDVPWRNMKGTRNRIAHGYFDINLDVIWETVQAALPPLPKRLPAIRDEVIERLDDQSGAS